MFCGIDNLGIGEYALMSLKYFIYFAKRKINMFIMNISRLKRIELCGRPLLRDRRFSAFLKLL